MNKNISDFIRNIKQNKFEETKKYIDIIEIKLDITYALLKNLNDNENIKEIKNKLNKINDEIVKEKEKLNNSSEDDLDISIEIIKTDIHIINNIKSIILDKWQKEVSMRNDSIIGQKPIPPSEKPTYPTSKIKILEPLTTKLPQEPKNQILLYTNNDDQNQTPSPINKDVNNEKNKIINKFKKLFGI
ncbi:MAG: hypothetical protein M1538_00030 [Candidatus Marsarchaeota archaeon]|jgi:hypothetical protein|nr:hypothetical protein [Candidatus Marsarchaeota archaeon]